MQVVRIQAKKCIINNHNNIHLHKKQPHSKIIINIWKDSSNNNNKINKFNQINILKLIIMDNKNNKNHKVKHRVLNKYILKCITRTRGINNIKEFKGRIKHIKDLKLRKIKLQIHKK